MAERFENLVQLFERSTRSVRLTSARGLVATGRLLQPAGPPEA